MGEGGCVKEEKKREIYGRREKQESGGCRNVHNEKPQNACCSHNIVRRGKPRRLKMWGILEMWE